eukprot:TsM_000216600 transcript=TsM_000216600 gene=TsM_000216600
MRWLSILTSKDAAPFRVLLSAFDSVPYYAFPIASRFVVKLVRCDLLSFLTVYILTYCLAVGSISVGVESSACANPHLDECRIQGESSILGGAGISTRLLWACALWEGFKFMSSFEEAIITCLKVEGGAMSGERVNSKLAERTALEHIRECAKVLGISLYDILLNKSDLSDDSSIRPSAFHRLKEKSSSHVQRIGKKKKKCGKICVSSIDHLLISVEYRRMIFLDRLSRILNDSTEWNPLCNKNTNSVLASGLWKLAALSSSAESVSDLNRFYVSSLSDFISPAQKKENLDCLHLLQILGRGPSQRTPGFVETSRFVMKKGVDGDGKTFFLEMLSRMVDSPICSDLSIYLDSGAHVFAHRFILAAWNPELFLLEENTTSINAPGVSKEALLRLLRALYTFDLSFLSSLPPEVEFTLDCWQMLDAVRNRIQSGAACGFANNPVVDTRKGSNFSNTSEPVIFPSGKNKISSQEVGGSDSLVDLFASTTDSSAFLGTPWNLLEHSTNAASHSTPHPHPLSDVDIPKPIDKLLDSSQTSGNARKNTMDLEKGVIEDKPVELEVDPPAFSENYDSSHTSTSLPSLPLFEQRVTERPDDVDHMPMGIAPPPSRNVTSDNRFFFDGSVPTPVPLAKRLRASADSAEGADTVFTLSSHPIEISSVKDDTESGNSDDDDDCQLLASFSQPLPTTPVNRRRISSNIATDVPITPKPAFDQMRTPELRKVLSDYGVRRLPKKKAIQLLNHIYDELHPYVEASSCLDDDESNDLKLAEALPCDCTAGVNSDEIVINPKPASDPLTPTTDQGASEANFDPDQEAANDSLRTQVWECLRSNDQLYFKIVAYVLSDDIRLFQPLELDCVKAMLRDAGINVGLRRLSEMLDSWVRTITVTVVAIKSLTVASLQHFHRLGRHFHNAKSTRSQTRNQYLRPTSGELLVVRARCLV